MGISEVACDLFPLTRSSSAVAARVIGTNGLALLIPANG